MGSNPVKYHFLKIRIRSALGFVCVARRTSTTSNKGRDTGVIRRNDGIARTSGNRDESHMPQWVVIGPGLRVSFAPVIVDLLVGLDDVRFERHGWFCVGRGHGDDGVDRIGLVIRHGERCARDDSTHGVADKDHGTGIGKLGVPAGASGIVIVSRSFRGKGTDLTIAASVSG